MPGISTTAEDSRRGGLGVIAFVFFILSFALSIGVQVLLARLSDGGSIQPPSEKIVVAKELVKPSSDFPPEKVVALQMEGLAANASSTGIQQCFVFASPSNKQITGPLTRFAAMLHRPPYNALLDHEVLLIGKPVVQDESASVVVTVLDNHNRIHLFQFMLSKQHGKDVENCWMTDAVFPLQQVPAEAPVDDATEDRTASGFMEAIQGRGEWFITRVSINPQAGRHG
jgi:hypothetical protein